MWSALRSIHQGRSLLIAIERAANPPIEGGASGSSRRSVWAIDVYCLGSTGFRRHLICEGANDDDYEGPAARCNCIESRSLEVTRNNPPPDRVRVVAKSMRRYRSLPMSSPPLIVVASGDRRLTAERRLARKARKL